MDEAARTLLGLLGAGDAAALIAAHDDKRWLRRPGSGGRFAELFGWDALSRTLETVPLSPPRIQLMRGGKEVPAAAYLPEREGVLRLDPGALTRELEAGATLIVNFLDELVPAVATLCDELAEVLEVRTGANLYASWRPTSGLALHADRHAVLVLQLGGAKTWTVYAPATTEAVWADPLDDGCWLYLPEGYPHIASAGQGPTLHLTIALTDPVRAGSGPEDIAEYPRHRAERLAAKVARPAFAFPHLGRLPPNEWSAQTRMRLASLRRLAVWSEGDGAFVLIGGTPWPCAPATALALKRLRDREATSLADLESPLAAVDRTELRRLLGVLFLAGALFAA